MGKLLLKIVFKHTHNPQYIIIFTADIQAHPMYILFTIYTFCIHKKNIYQQKKFLCD